MVGKIIAQKNWKISEGQVKLFFFEDAHLTIRIISSFQILKTEKRPIMKGNSKSFLEKKL